MGGAKQSMISDVKLLAYTLGVAANETEKAETQNMSICSSPAVRQRRHSLL